MARHLGFPSKEKLLESMSAQQAQQWEVFGILEPFPEDRIIHTLQYIAAIFANGTLKKKNGGKWTVKDFQVTYFTPIERAKKALPLGKMKDMVLAIGAAFGVKVKQKKQDPYRLKYEAEKYIPKRYSPPKNLVKRIKK